MLKKRDVERLRRRGQQEIFVGEESLRHVASDRVEVEREGLRLPRVGVGDETVARGGQFQRNDVRETAQAVVDDKRTCMVVQKETHRTVAHEGEGVDSGDGDGEEGAGGDVARGGNARVFVREGKAGCVVAEVDRVGTEQTGVHCVDIRELLENACARSVLCGDGSGEEVDQERIGETVHIQLEGNCPVLEVAERGDLLCFVVEVNHARSRIHNTHNGLRKCLVERVDVRIRVWDHCDICVIEGTGVFTCRPDDYM